MKRNIELKPCPFCGCDEPYIYYAAPGFAVMCPRYYCNRTVITFFGTKDEAVDYWNKAKREDPK